MRPLKCFAPSCLRVPALVGPCAAQQPSTVAAFTRCLVSYRGCVRLLHPPRHPMLGVLALIPMGAPASRHSMRVLC